MDVFELTFWEREAQAEASRKKLAMASAVSIGFGGRDSAGAVAVLQRQIRGIHRKGHKKYDEFWDTLESRGK
jgi:hypothetical protein